LAEESFKPSSTPTGAVFLSYASEDVSAADRIAAALRAAGIEVWIDKSELRGGDAWDQSIRKQIKACALFIPIISRHAHDRIEGYFRLEWKLAVDRSHLIAPDQAFLIPVAIDDTPQSDERIPDRFRELQWTCLPAGETTQGFIERVRRLLLHEASSARVTVAPVSLTSTAHASGGGVAPPWRSKVGLWLTGAVLAVALAYIAVDKRLVSRHPTPLTPSAAPPTQTPAPAPATAAAFNPPPHSVAVLPFVNMSGDKQQEYFSDGLSEELLNDLARINELQVAARTSAFSFKGKDTDIGTIGRKLNVRAVLEGSVRRSAHTVRVTAQLINSVTGFHMWSQSYDRNLGDVLKLQTDIAQAVSNALKVTLLSDVPSRIDVGGTRSPAAYDAYLRATSGYWRVHSASELMQVINGYREAVRLDPNFALAFAGLSLSLAAYAQFAGPAVLDWKHRARDPARRAIALAPDLAEGHVALAASLTDSLDFKGASEEYERAAALAPGNARVLRDYGLFAVSMGQTEAGLTALRRAAALDPLNWASHNDLIEGLRLARRYDDSLAAYHDALSQIPDNANMQWNSGLVYYALGDIQRVRSLCESKLKEGNEEAPWEGCLAVVYQKLGRPTDAEAWMEKNKAKWGDAGAVGYAVTYAQWGDTSKALEWLEKGLRLHDVDLQGLKVDPLLDPLRKEPRFQAIERELKFPD
jgi:TolB-like protein/tetratricopeptide (TPR) repeat protein